jgi:hypothetical protein
MHILREPNMEDNPEKGLIELTDPNSFRYYDEDDSYFYHVTSSANVDSILDEGFDVSNKMFGSSYRAHSMGRVFFTDKSGVMYWKSRVEDRLFDQFDDPPEVAVVRIQKSALLSVLSPDEIGSQDARHPAYYGGVHAVNESLALGQTEQRVRSSFRLG